MVLNDPIKDAMKVTIIFTPSLICLNNLKSRPKVDEYNTFCNYLSPVEGLRRSVSYIY